MWAGGGGSGVGVRGGVIDYTVSCICMCCTFFVMLDGMLCVCLLGDDMHVTWGAGVGWGDSLHSIMHVHVLYLLCGA